MRPRSGKLSSSVADLLRIPYWAAGVALIANYQGLTGGEASAL
jgi:hypothetical protein